MDALVFHYLFYFPSAEYIIHISDKHRDYEGFKAALEAREAGFPVSTVIWWYQGLGFDIF